MAALTRPSLARRLLTVGYSSYPWQRDRWPLPAAVPYLRLLGHWLRQAGFAAGQKVDIHVADGCITIIPVRES